MYFLFLYSVADNHISSLEPECFEDVEESLQRMKQFDAFVDIESELNMLKQYKHSTNYFDNISGYSLRIVSDKIVNYHEPRLNKVFLKGIESWKTKNRNEKIETILK